MTSILQKKNRLNFPTDSVFLQRLWPIILVRSRARFNLAWRYLPTIHDSPRGESYNASKKLIKSENQTIVSIVRWGKKTIDHEYEVTKKTILLKEGFQFHATVKNIGEKMLTSSEEIFWNDEKSNSMLHDGFMFDARNIFVTTWWLNQPIWKRCASQIGSFPQIGMKNDANKRCLKPPPRSWHLKITIIERKSLKIFP